VKKRAALSGLDALPAKKQQKKKAMSAKDRRRVSFAPEAELTLVHHFVKVRSVCPSVRLMLALFF
jgi:hypothetical protein